jgi:PKD repeat protein
LYFDLQYHIFSIKIKFLKEKSLMKMFSEEGKISKIKVISACIVLIAMVVIIPGCKKAVLIAVENSVLHVSVNPSSIPVGGTSTVKVVGNKPSGTPLPDGTVVYFSSDIGSIDGRAETLDGIAYAAFRSDDNRSGTANIVVTSGNAQMSPETVTITVGGSTLSTLSVSADPQVLSAGGGISTIRVIARDENLNPVSGVPVTLTTDAGQLASSGAVLYTDNDGAAEDVLTTTTTAVVTATSGSVSVDITITVESNDTPSAAFVYSPTNPIVGQKVYFNAKESTDPDGDPLIYAWDFGDGRSAEGMTATHRYQNPGTYTVLLQVTDSKGNKDSISQTITIGKGEPPTASFVYSPTNPGIGETVYFNAGESSDPDDDIVTYDWDFGDGTTASGKNTTHQYANAGSYTVLLVLTDDAGNKNSTSQTITVASTNLRPGK